jgi:ADP-heptose:LPS heptosyltransferase
MAGLDLVISSDTSIAHLAGALARPTWVALNASPDWRWLLDRTDSPWYPTMRLFRQPANNSGWEPVIAELATALAQRAAQR